MADIDPDKPGDFFAAERPEDWIWPRADLYAGIATTAVGLAILWFSVDMPTFYDKGGETFHAPGIVPGFYGAIVAILGAVLSLRSVLRGALDASGGAHGAPEKEGTSNARLFTVAGLGLVFVVGLIGRMPFWLATALFVSSFIVVFEWRDAGNRRRMLATAVAVGLIGGAAVTWLFQDIFLVRLP